MVEVERTGETADLFGRVSALIEQTRAAVATQVNAALTLLNWQIGHLIDTEVLAEQRAEYAHEIVVTLSRQLTKRYGRGFDRANLYRMRQFAQVFPDRDSVATLSRQVSWSHFIALVAVDHDAARAFYIQQTLDARLSVRALRELIGRQGFGRREIENAQTPGRSAVPLDTFNDPYFLDFLGLKDTYDGCDREDALIHEMKTFLLDVGNGWAFEVGNRSNCWRCTRTASSSLKYWTALPPKEELQQRITQISRAAKERVARRALGRARDDEDEDDE